MVLSFEDMERVIRRVMQVVPYGNGWTPRKLRVKTVPRLYKRGNALYCTYDIYGDSEFSDGDETLDFYVFEQWGHFAFNARALGYKSYRDFIVSAYTYMSTGIAYPRTISYTLVDDTADENNDGVPVECVRVLLSDDNSNRAQYVLLNREYTQSFIYRFMTATGLAYTSDTDYVCHTTTGRSQDLDYSVAPYGAFSTLLTSCSVSRSGDDLFGKFLIPAWYVWNDVIPHQVWYIEDDKIRKIVADIYATYNKSVRNTLQYVTAFQAHYITSLLSKVLSSDEFYAQVVNYVREHGTRVSRALVMPTKDEWDDKRDSPLMLIGTNVRMFYGTADDFMRLACNVWDICAKSLSSRAQCVQSRVVCRSQAYLYDEIQDM